MVKNLLFSILISAVPMKNKVKKYQQGGAQFYDIASLPTNNIALTPFAPNIQLRTDHNGAANAQRIAGAFNRYAQMEMQREQMDIQRERMEMQREIHEMQKDRHAWQRQIDEWNMMGKIRDDFLGMDFLVDDKPVYEEMMKRHGLQEAVKSGDMNRIMQTATNISADSDYHWMQRRVLDRDRITKEMGNIPAELWDVRYSNVWEVQSALIEGKAPPKLDVDVDTFKLDKQKEAEDQLLTNEVKRQEMENRAILADYQGRLIEAKLPYMDQIIEGELAEIESKLANAETDRDIKAFERDAKQLRIDVLKEAWEGIDDPVTKLKMLDKIYNRTSDTRPNNEVSLAWEILGPDATPEEYINMVSQLKAQRNIYDVTGGSLGAGYMDKNGNVVTDTYVYNATNLKPSWAEFGNRKVTVAELKDRDIDMIMMTDPSTGLEMPYLKVGWDNEKNVDFLNELGISGNNVDDIAAKYEDRGGGNVGDFGYIPANAPMLSASHAGEAGLLDASFIPDISNRPEGQKNISNYTGNFLNIKITNPSQPHVNKDEGGHRVFLKNDGTPDYEAGWNASVEDVQAKLSGSSAHTNDSTTMREMYKIFATSATDAKTQKIVDALGREGVTLDTTMKELRDMGVTADELARAMVTVESPDMINFIPAGRPTPYGNF